MNLKMEKAKLCRELKRSGKEYKIYRKGKNEFGEPDDEPKEVGALLAIYHESNGYVSKSLGDTTSYRSKKQPMLLCLYEDATFLLIGDVVIINEKEMLVTGVTNIQEWGIIGDVSLEVFDNGK